MRGRSTGTEKKGMCGAQYPFCMDNRLSSHGVSSSPSGSIRSCDCIRPRRSIRSRSARSCSARSCSARSCSARSRSYFRSRSRSHSSSAAQAATGNCHYYKTFAFVTPFDYEG